MVGHGFAELNDHTLPDAELSGSRRRLIRDLEKAVTNILNRDPWRLVLREDSMPGKWDEDPPIEYLVQ